MAFLEIKNVRITGISACVPREIEENITLPLFSSKEEAEKFIETTGVKQRHISKKHLTSDLCYEAAERMIADLGWAKGEIDALIFVTQGPDYIIPATSCILQNRLGLNEECYTLDISLGCSGWVYALSVSAGLLQTGMMRKALLLCGDTAHATSVEDKSAYPLFGEAGTVTALEFEEANSLKFHFATDGSGYDAIIIPDGGFRNPFSEKSLQIDAIEPGIRRSRLNTILNGMDVFSFGISKAPKTVRKLAEKFDLDLASTDYFVFHQANKFMNEKIRKKLNLPEEKVPYSLKNFGNTSSASIPLTILTELKKEASLEKHSFIACGFGVGLSWATVAFELDKIVISRLVEI
jgi:3-oxoacyl-[acyl-carrier-protein] synthase III